MTPSLLSGAIVCPVRFIHLTLFAALVVTTSPFAANTRPADEFTAARPGPAISPGGTATVDDVPVDGSRRQPSPERAPVPLPFAPQPERRSPRGSALNRITILH